jgi:transposase
MGITNEQPPRQQRKRLAFCNQFKRDAVALVTTGGYMFAAAAKSPKSGEQSLRQWHARFAPPLDFAARWPRSPSSKPMSNACVENRDGPRRNWKS